MQNGTDSQPDSFIFLSTSKAKLSLLVPTFIVSTPFLIPLITILAASFMRSTSSVDFSLRSLWKTSEAAFVNAFYVSSVIVALGTILFAIKVARLKLENNV
jgi:ABC-type spermidine/putrescine transport system permease subunit II